MEKDKSTEQCSSSESYISGHESSHSPQQFLSKPPTLPPEAFTTATRLMSSAGKGGVVNYVNAAVDPDVASNFINTSSTQSLGCAAAVGDNLVQQAPSATTTSPQRNQQLLERVTSIINYDDDPGRGSRSAALYHPSSEHQIPEPTPMASTVRNFAFVDRVSIAQSDVWAREDRRLISNVIDVLTRGGEHGVEQVDSLSSPSWSHMGPWHRGSKEQDPVSRGTSMSTRKRKWQPSTAPQLADPDMADSKISVKAFARVARIVPRAPKPPRTWCIISEYEIQELETMIKEDEEQQEKKGKPNKVDDKNEAPGQQEDPPANPKPGNSKKKSGRRFRSHQLELWLKRFREFIDFRNEHGHVWVPNKYPPNPFLAQWVKRQRYQYKLKLNGRHSTVSAAREEALNRLGFVWNSHQANWMERWNELAEYYRQNGHSNVPTEYSENRHLSIWVKCQRRQYRLYRRTGSKSNMTPERIAKLESLEFNWDPRGLEEDDDDAKDDDGP